MKNIFIVLIAFGFLAIGCTDSKAPKYDETWESLANHNESPEWFNDAKFGIYFHWGVFSVPAWGDEWYPRHMHFNNPNNPKAYAFYKHHCETYGEPSEFGYHDFVPMFKAEKFDAKQWATLFKKSGAQFAGPVAEHHDGFSMWDSEATPWNSMDKGPKRDITGELSKEIKAQGLKLITTFHHSRNLQRYKDSIDEKKFQKSHYPYVKGMPTSSEDPELRMMYGNMPEAEWLEDIWFAKLKEVIDAYQPDIIWFDTWLDAVPEAYRKKFCAYYLNEAEKLGKDVVIVRKQDDLPLSISVDDLEKSRKNKIEEKTWMTDETVSFGSWCYTDNLQIKPAEDVLHVLIDIVSKNGILLLNVSPMANGIIPQEQQDVLLKMGDWLGKYGEAIYGTRPWNVFGEGPTVEPEGHFKNHKAFEKIKYTNKDVRYTTKEGVVYVTVLGATNHGDALTLNAFKGKEVSNVTLLGSNQAVDWKVNQEGMLLNMESSDEMAVVYKVKLK